MADTESASSVDNKEHNSPSNTPFHIFPDVEKVDEATAVDNKVIEKTEADDLQTSLADSQENNELSSHEMNNSEALESQINSQEEQTKDQDEYNAAAAAALADFDAEEDGDGNGDDDDTVNVIIKPTSKGGIYKTGAAYQARSMAHLSQHAKVTRQGIELDDPGDIHGVPTLEFNLSTLGEEDKPWKRPGADITDYFNYGFTEETWIQYCEKQKILRQEYANSTLKPVLGGNTTGLLQRIRTSGANTGIRSYDNLKSSSINVISLSNATMGSRSSGASLLGPKDDAEEQSSSIDGVTSSNSNNLLNQFSQPPPGYLTGATQLVEGAGGTSGVGATGVFALPPPGFSALNGAASAQLLSNAAATGSGTSSNVFPNMNMPPPILGTLAANWTGSLGVHNLLNADALIDPTTGQITGILDHSRRSPESVYSNDDHGSRRSRRHYPEDSYFERDGYRSSRKRSRSGSRDRHYSRHHRYHDSRHPDRDYDRRSRHSHRSRERRYSGGGGLDDLDGFCPPTSAIISSRSMERRSDRDRRSERSSDRDHRGGNRRDQERSSRSSRRSRHRSGSRRREFESPSKSPGHFASEDSQTQSGTPTSKPSDPLAIAAAAAANIAAALGATN